MFSNNILGYNFTTNILTYIKLVVEKPFVRQKHMLLCNLSCLHLFEDTYEHMEWNRPHPQRPCSPCRPVHIPSLPVALLSQNRALSVGESIIVQLTDYFICIRICSGNKIKGLWSYSPVKDANLLGERSCSPNVCLSVGGSFLSE